MYYVGTAVRSVCLLVTVVLLTVFQTPVARAQSAGNLDSLIQNLASLDATVRSTAEEDLVKAGAQALSVLIPALNSKEFNVRLGAVRALGKIGDKQALDPLAGIVDDPSWVIRKEIAAALGAMKDASSVKPLMRLLQDEYPDVRDQAYLSLPDMKDVKIPLIPLLKDPSWQVRFSAAKLLGKTRDPNAVEPLIRAMTDEHSEVRVAVREALGKIGRPAVGPLAKALKNSDWRVRAFAAEALGNTRDASGVGPLIAALKDGNYTVRNKASSALQGIGAPAVPALVAALKSKSSDRHAIARVLGDIGAASVSPLLPLLKSRDFAVSMLAADVLGKTKDAHAIKPLVGYLSDGGDGDALVAIGPPAVSPVCALLKHRDSEVRTEAARVLGEIGDARAVLPLISALSDKDPRARCEAAEALVKLDGAALGPLERKLSSPTQSVRTMAAWALEVLGEGTSVDRLLVGKDLNQIALDHQKLVKKCKPGQELSLIIALERYGDAEMAKHYLNCGNDLLEWVAMDWAHRNGYMVLPVFGN